MTLQSVNVLFPFAGEGPADLEQFIEIFHPWVATQSLEGMLIDVVDYRHVPDGPGVVLIGLEGDFYLNEIGLRYSRKAPIAGSSADALRQAFSAVETVANRLEETVSGLKFCRKQIEVSINDRAIAPNTAESFATLKSDLVSFLSGELGADSVEIEHKNGHEPRQLLTATVSAESPLETGKLVAG